MKKLLTFQQKGAISVSTIELLIDKVSHFSIYEYADEEEFDVFIERLAVDMLVSRRLLSGVL